MEIVKIILGGILCLFLGLNVLAQEEGRTDETNNAPVKIEQISLLRDDGAGKAGDETESFSTADKILHFRIQLTSQKVTMVKITLVATDVKGIKPETKSVTVSYKTNGKQSIVNFHVTPEDAWLPGKYRTDVFIDGNLSDKKEFEIQSSGKEPEKEPPPAPKPAEKPVSKPIRRTRKN